jgi:hypothetical protein
VAGLIEVGTLQEGDDAIRVRIGLHDGLEDEVHFERAGVAVGDGVGGQWFDHSDMDAVGPLEVAHVPFRTRRELQPRIFSPVGQLPGVGGPVVPHPGPAVADVGVRSGLAVRPGTEIALRHVPREPARLGLPPPIGQLLVVEVVVRRDELAVGAFAAQLIQVDSESGAHLVAKVM